MDNKKEMDILVKFTYDCNQYVIVTDNSYHDDGDINVFGAKLGKDDRLEDVVDVDMTDIFNTMIEEYRQKILRGEI